MGSESIVLSCSNLNALHSHPPTLAENAPQKTCTALGATLLRGFGRGFRFVLRQHWIGRGPGRASLIRLRRGDILDALAQLAQTLVQQAIALDVLHLPANFLVEPIQFAPLPGE